MTPYNMAQFYSVEDPILTKTIVVAHLLPRCQYTSEFLNDVSWLLNITESIDISLLADDTAYYFGLDLGH